MFWLLLASCAPNEAPDDRTVFVPFTPTGGTSSLPPVIPGTTDSGTPPSVDPCAAPLAPLAEYPVASTAAPGSTSGLGALPSVVGAVVPGGVLDLSWAVSSGIAVTWYVGDALASDCLPTVGGACRWVEGAAAAQSTSVGGVAVGAVSLDAGLVPGDLVAIQAVSDAEVSPVWLVGYEASAAAPDTLRGDPWARLYPGTYQGLHVSPQDYYRYFVLRIDAGETAQIAASWDVWDDDEEVDVTVYALESGTPVSLVDATDAHTWELTSPVSQWLQIAVSNGFYELADTPLQITVTLAAPAVERTWYADADADGWGDATGPIVALARPPFASDDLTDCDDGDAAVFPGAPEVCGDGRDDDCDGRDDCATAADADPGDAALSVWQEEGPPGVASPDLTGDGFADLLVEGGGVFRVLAGPFLGDRYVGTSLGGVPETGLEDVVGLGDLDGDGFGEIAAQAMGTGRIDLLSGPFEGTQAPTCGVAITSPAVSTRDFVPRLAGDTDGDGLAELLAVGAFDDGTGVYPGVTLYRSPTSDRTPVDADVQVAIGAAGTATGQGWLEAVTSDRDGDGLADLAVFDSVNGYLTEYLAPLAPRYDNATPIRILPVDYGELGLATDDWNGDGLPDLAVSAGQEHLPNGMPKTARFELLSHGAVDPFATIEIVTFDQWFFEGTWAPGDIDGDGSPDLVLVGGREHDAFRLTGPLSGVIDPYATAATLPGVVYLTPGGDLTGDGRPDLVAPGSMGGEPPELSATWILSGF